MRTENEKVHQCGVFFVNIEPVYQNNLCYDSYKTIIFDHAMFMKYEIIQAYGDQTVKIVVIAEIVFK